jgi:hypothetical protein
MPSNAALPATVPVATSTDAVTWVEVSVVHHQAHCTCNWVGPRRVLFRRPAAVDALVHAAKNGCVPAVPLRRTILLRPHAARTV